MALKNNFFTNTFKLILLQSVTAQNTHRAGHGRQDKNFEEVRVTFLENVATAAWRTQQQPSVKTLRDKLRNMMSTRKAKVTENLGASGIT